MKTPPFRAGFLLLDTFLQSLENEIMSSLDSDHQENEFDQANSQKLKYLLSTTDVVDIIKNIEEYKIDINQLLKSVIKLGSNDDIVECVELISPQNKTSFLRLLIAEDKERIDDVIERNIDAFICSENKIDVFELLLREADYIIFSNINKFKGIDNNKLQTALTEAEHYDLIAINIDLFHSVDRIELATKLMDSISGLLVLSEEIQDFPDLDKYVFLEKLIENNLEGKIYESVEKIVEVNNSDKYADLLIKSGRYGVIIKFPLLFPNANFREIYNKLVEERKVNLILSNYQLFPNINWDELYEILTKDKGKSSLLLIIKHAEYFPNINLAEILKLICDKYGSGIIEKNISHIAKQGVKELEEVLFEANEADVIARNLDLFPTIDLHKLAESLFKQKKWDEIASNISKFPFINQAGKLALVKVLVKSDAAKLIFQERELIKSIDPQELSEILMNQGSFQELLQNYQIFPNLNFNRILSALIKIEGGIYLIKEHLHLFIEKNQAETVNILSENGHLDLIARHIDEFSNLDIEAYFKKAIKAGKFYLITELAYKLDSAGRENILREVIEHKQKSPINQNSEEHASLTKFYAWKNIISPDLFKQYLDILDQSLAEKNKNKNKKKKPVNFLNISEQGITEKIQPELIADEIPSVMEELYSLNERETLKLINTCKNDRLYKSLQIIIKTKNLDAVKVGLNWKVVKKELLLLTKNENFATAGDLLNCVRLLFKENEEEIHNWQQILEKNQVVKEVSERSRFENMDTLKEFFTYYLNVLLLKNHSVANIPENAFAEIRSEIQSLFSKIKEYVVTAVLSEMDWDREKSSSNLSWFANPSIYLSYMDEEMRVFFENAAKRFKNRRFFSKNTYGGEKWEVIARLGELFWNNHYQADLGLQIALINIAIGTQHNSGSFFDKDENRVKLSNDKLKKFLDFEAAENHRLESLIEYGLANQIITPQEHQHYIALQEKFTQKTNDSTGNLDPDKIYHKAADKKVQKIIRHLVENPSLPAEIRSYVQSIYSKSEGFKQNTTGREYLGRLLKTIDIKWTKEDENFKYYKKNENEIYYLDIEGYELAFWYIEGKLKNIRDVKDLHENKQKLAEATETVIVKAMLGTVREGD